ncbi:MAG: hypothetical protein IJI37_00375, partial [Opitutales bacterium]|nr:hypothetical protein [Opitutales bacterium]
LEKSHRAQNSEEAKKLLESALNSVASRAGVPAERKINALRRLIQLDPHNAKAGAELKRLLDLSKK